MKFLADIYVHTLNSRDDESSIIGIMPPKRNTYLNQTQVASLLFYKRDQGPERHGFWGLGSGFWLGGFAPDQWLDKVRTIPKSVGHTLTTLARPANETAHLSLQPTPREVELYLGLLFHRWKRNDYLQHWSIYAAWESLQI